MNAPAKNSSWHALNVDSEAAAREAVEYALMEAGALGTVTKDSADGLMRITGYFETIPDREQVRVELLEALRIYNLRTSSVRDMSIEQIDNRDWLEEWKKNWQPVIAGRFIIAPPWSDLSQVTGPMILRIEPGMAFGTGTHETTRLCLAAIEKHYLGGSFLDVGTGTGILAMAAAKLYPEAKIQACDTDEEAIEIARENAAANGVDQQIEFRVGSVDETSPSADLVCANLTADVISPLLPTLLKLTCGKLILSGILDIQSQALLDQIRASGISDVEVTQDGEWVCLVV
jgi:ribosomal protein L11 methyltransferase